MSDITFKQLGLTSQLLQALDDLGWKHPSPIQAQSIPVMLQGRDLLAQAQTGTGKTGAFGLPILGNIDISTIQPQALVLAPTRELAIQVANSFQAFAQHMPGLKVLPIYGGQEYRVQLNALKRGVHVVVGTPGRVMDHLRRGTLVLDKLKFFVLDEADEMLNMGFKEDVEWILEHVTGAPQTALFSATLPPAIQNISKRYLKDAIKIQITSKAPTVAAIQQNYSLVAQEDKFEALTRFLEMQPFDGVIVFTRTKQFSEEVARRLIASGYSAAALNGDMNQAVREKVIDRLKQKSLDILVATDVAARGLDVERISHVINYDIPYDSEAYIHRIGRTGRAGRNGVALMLVTPREQRMLRDIERVIKKPIEMINPPTTKDITSRRVEQFTKNLLQTLQDNKLNFERELITRIIAESDCSELDIAAAMAYLLQKDRPLRVKEDKKIIVAKFNDKRKRPNNRSFKKDAKKNFVKRRKKRSQ